MRVYLIGAFRPHMQRPDAVKIGIARDMRKRLETIQTGNHLQCRVIAVWIVPSVRRALEIERQAHQRFKRVRLCGEWFKPEVRRIVDFLNTRLAEGRENPHEAHERASADEADAQLLDEYPWLSHISGGMH